MSFKIFIVRAIINCSRTAIWWRFGPRRQTNPEGKDPISRQRHQDVLAPDVHTGERERERDEKEKLRTKKDGGWGMNGAVTGQSSAETQKRGAAFLQFHKSKSAYHAPALQDMRACMNVLF